MFPERDIASDFWLFVRGLAIDPRSREDDEHRVSSETLDELEYARCVVQERLAVNTDAEFGYPRDNPKKLAFYKEGGRPWVYRTLQEALTAFLVDRAALDRISYTYEIWLRTVILIVADAQRDPDWLRVIADDIEELEYKGLPHHDHSCRWEHTMTVSDDWDCLRRETFDHIISTYSGRG